MRTWDVSAVLLHLWVHLQNLRRNFSGERVGKHSSPDPRRRACRKRGMRSRDGVCPRHGASWPLGAPCFGCCCCERILGTAFFRCARKLTFRSLEHAHEVTPGPPGFDPPVSGGWVFFAPRRNVRVDQGAFVQGDALTEGPGGIESPRFWQAPGEVGSWGSGVLSAVTMKTLTQFGGHSKEASPISPTPLSGSFPKALAEDASGREGLPGFEHAVRPGRWVSW